VDMTTTPCPRSTRRPLTRILGGVALALSAAWGAPAATQHAGPAGRAEAVFPDKTVVALEVARTEPERSRGLMHRASMPERAGMIFLFERPGIYPFWMKNTLIPLDLFWTDTNGTIVWIAESVPPCQADPCPEYPPKAIASYVIETNAGFAKRHSVKIGDVVTLRKLPK
jgi:uncharacterized membrane protein (UPF0127 family)